MTNPAHVTAFADQASAAARDARAVFDHLASADDRIRSYGQATPWFVDLVTKVLTGPPRYTRCKHLRGLKSPAVMFLTAHTRRLECSRCTALTTAAVVGTREDRTCDRCRKLMAPGSVLGFVTLIGHIVVAAGHCADCSTEVRGVRA